MKRVILILAIMSVATVATAQSHYTYNIGSIGRGGRGGGYGGYGYNRPSYGYANVPFDGRYGIPGLPGRGGSNVHYSDSFFGNHPGDYLRMDGKVGNYFTDSPAVPKVVKNPFVAKGPKKAPIAVQNDKGEWVIQDE